MIVGKEDQKIGGDQKGEKEFLFDSQNYLAIKKGFIYITAFIFCLVSCVTKNKNKGMNNLVKSVAEDTDALRYKIINNFKWPYKKPDTIILSNEMSVCRTDDGGDAFLLKMDEHPYIDSLERKIGISLITKDEYYTCYCSGQGKRI